MVIEFVSIDDIDIPCSVPKASCIDGNCRGRAGCSLLSSSEVLRDSGGEIRPLGAPTTELAVDDGYE